MSLGYVGMCRKELEDNKMAIYFYSGENWNDGGKSKMGDRLLYDGSFIIYKDYLEKHTAHTPNLSECLANNEVIIERECKNAFRQHSMSMDYIAFHLILHIFKEYQSTRKLPDECSFIQ